MLATAGNVSKADTPAAASDATALIAGAVTCVATILLNAVLTRVLGFDLLSLSVFFIVPYGAAIGGACAASGFYLAALRANIMPSGRLLKQVFAITAIAWFLSHWLEYRLITLDDGTPLSSVASFWEFFRYQTTHQRLVLRNPGMEPTGELGKLGYVREALQLLGFLLGGFVLMAALTTREACLECRAYATRKKLLSLVKLDKLQRVLTLAQLSFPDWEVATKAAESATAPVTFSLTLLKCPKCEEQSALLVVIGKNKMVKLTTYPLSAEQSALLSQAAPAGKR